MNKFLLRWLGSFLSLCLWTGTAGADTVTPAQLTVELRDGSRLVGQSTEKHFKFHSDLLGDLKLPVTAIRSMDCTATNEAKLITTRGDTLTVSFADSDFDLKTSFGKVTITVATLRHLSVSGSGLTGAHPPGLIALWTGENNGKDAVGHNDLTLTDVTQANGRTGRAFSLNGSSSCMELADTSGVNVGESDGFTISAWIKPENVSGLHPILEWNPTEIGYPGFLGVQLWLGDFPNSEGVLKACISTTDHQFRNLVSGPETIVPGQFQHVAITYDKVSGVGILYLNGRALSRQLLGHLDPLTQGPLWISRRPTDHPGDWTYNTFFQGLLDDIAIYNRALTPEEIRTEAQAN